jgi:hypothetical protein
MNASALAHITRVDFGEFWKNYAPVYTEDLLRAKRDLLDAGVPALTAYAYFHYYLRLSPDGFLSYVEQILADLEDLDYLESLASEAVSS